MNSLKPLVDHRVYTIELRKMPEFLDVFNRLAMPLLMRTLGHPLGFWTSLVGVQNQFVHLWGYDDPAIPSRAGEAQASAQDSSDDQRLASQQGADAASGHGGGRHADRRAEFDQER